jgi:hypothetical protein
LRNFFGSTATSARFWSSRSLFSGQNFTLLKEAGQRWILKFCDLYFFSILFSLDLFRNSAYLCLVFLGLFELFYHFIQPFFIVQPIISIGLF